MWSLESRSRLLWQSLGLVSKFEPGLGLGFYDKVSISVSSRNLSHVSVSEVTVSTTSLAVDLQLLQTSCVLNQLTMNRSRPAFAVLNLMAVQLTQHCSILDRSLCFATLNALSWLWVIYILRLCFMADFNIDYIFEHFVKIKLTLRHWNKWKKWEVEPVEVKSLI